MLTDTLVKTLNIALKKDKLNPVLDSIQSIGLRHYATDGAVIIRSFPQDMTPVESDLSWESVFDTELGNIEVDPATMKQILSAMTLNKIQGLNSNHFVFDGESATITQGTKGRFLPEVELSIGVMLAKKKLSAFKLCLSSGVLKQLIAYRTTGITLLSNGELPIYTCNDQTEAIFMPLAVS